MNSAVHSLKKSLQVSTKKKLVLEKNYPGALHYAWVQKTLSLFTKSNPPPPGPTSKPRFRLLL